MSTTLKHAKVKTTIPQADGSQLIKTASYYEELNSIKEEVSQHIETNGRSLAVDIIKCLKHITERQTQELTLHITTDKKTGEALLITKTYTTKKEYYGR
jgi:hypothetical protein